MSVYQHVLPGMQAEAAVAFAQVLRNAHQARTDQRVPGGAETASTDTSSGAVGDGLLELLAGVADPGVAAEVAAEALRVVNRLTLAGPAPSAAGWESVSDLYRVLTDLRVLADRLPQALDQLARHLEQPAGRDFYMSDAGSSASAEAPAATAVGALQDAGCDARQLGVHLNAAQSSVAHLHG